MEEEAVRLKEGSESFGKHQQSYATTMKGTLMRARSARTKHLMTFTVATDPSILMMEEKASVIRRPTMVCVAI